MMDGAGKRPRTSEASGASQAATHDAAPAPGKSTLTGALQQRTTGAPAAAPLAPADAREVASSGVAGGGQPLPHLDRIQASFGAHDVGGTTAHVGGAAADASRELGAHAFATGDHVGFAAPPDLHLAAHEAAHVVQQRGGVQLAGGVGREGDVYERHADAVADRVVRGESAEALLGQHAPAAARSGATGVQLSPDDEADAPGRKGVKDRRLVITFLMGADGGFYVEAEGYWAQAGKADVLVKSARTFGDVMAYLTANAPANGKPWAEINIVVHANEDGGMSMKFDQDSKTNIDQPELQAKVDKGQVTALPDTIVDHGTNVNVHGCALGRNQAMLKTLSAAIGGTDKEAPTVYGTKDLQAYGHTGNAHEEFLAEYWTVGYPAKAPIKGKPLADAFRAQYASVTGIDWDKEAPKGEKKHRGYDGVADLGHMIIPPQTSKAGHTALLKAVGKGQDWDSWSVLEQTTTVVGDKDKTTFKYQYKKGDETGTQSFSIENTRVPKTKVEQDAYVKAELGADFDLYSWTYKLVDQVGAVGDTVTATFTYTGAREFVRVKRILEDAQHNKLDPPRTDAAHYGHYTPPQPAPAVP